jgi:glycosyltransferase involved in cell wall biosynthesis
MISPSPLNVAINAEALPERNGGAALALLALVRALGALDDGNESYRLVVSSSQEAKFWGQHLSGNQSLVDRSVVEPKPPKSRRIRRLRRALGSLWFQGERLVQELNPVSPRVWPEVAVSTGFYESLGCEVVHFPLQLFEVCALPCVFNPHDLQHLHYPQFFDVRELIYRETAYPIACRFSATVIVGSQWAKDDITRQYGTSPDKIQVIPEGSPTQFGTPIDEETKRRVSGRYGLHAPFALYPAITWAHKNHVRLLEAIALLRARGLVVPLVCTGSLRQPHWSIVEQRLRSLGLEAQARFLGYVPEEDLRAIQQLAHALVLPSLFEASSLPIYEAWMEGLPVASSNITALPEQVGEAGLLFDPLDVDAMADAVATLMTDERVRERLRAKGRARLEDFDWNRTARCYRAVYRKAAGRVLSADDRALLAWDWSRFPSNRPALHGSSDGAKL